jgi:hypothetical protein
VLIYMIADASGGHINPAVSVGALFARASAAAAAAAFNLSAVQVSPWRSRLVPLVDPHEPMLPFI